MGRRLLVTGSGRCGTRWIAEQLQAPHETAFSLTRHGDGDWTSEVSWLAAPYTPITDTYVVHLVRDPRQQVRSLALGGNGWTADSPYFRFALSWVPEMAKAGSMLRAAALHWVAWNRLVTAQERLRIEDVTADDITRLSGRSHELGPPVGVHDTDWPDVEWHDIDVPGLYDLAERYGYR